MKKLCTLMLNALIITQCTHAMNEKLKQENFPRSPSHSHANLSAQELDAIAKECKAKHIQCSMTTAGWKKTIEQINQKYSGVINAKNILSLMTTCYIKK